MVRKVIFPGSFDPFTNGHLDLVKRLSLLFDEVIIAIGQNQNKTSLFSPDERKILIEKIILETQIEHVEVLTYDGLTMKLVQTLHAQAIARGVRSAGDYQYEKNIAELNQKIAGVETVFLMARPENQAISSSMVKELAHFDADITTLVPKSVVQAIQQKYQRM
ncbi:pantetheine-phosphate adenylyltransferase [Weissella coleopterorum]|uniref:Phosphopantetheine adenylyltransferase n=1 Tax=Weissella coleopterorum TaxID=2714949 RepID=A0A6G8B0D7_9LACO|nr:pantetheine-phosphate adenylyltransferase [Weissella coleopterorum]QIL50690.1 pantetheine-phosphate adenylyltransferase [Weissella coleopterorum]